jgi:carbon storage regulator CsrA
VEVTVMAVNGAQVRIGIKAPISISVDREEVAERKRREKENPAGFLNR